MPFNDLSFGLNDPSFDFNRLSLGLRDPSFDLNFRRNRLHGSGIRNFGFNSASRFNRINRFGSHFGSGFGSNLDFGFDTSFDLGFGGFGGFGSDCGFGGFGGFGYGSDCGCDNDGYSRSKVSYYPNGQSISYESTSGNWC